MKMQRFSYLIIWLLLPAWLLAQTNISTVEYWYDSDYSTASRQTVSGPIVNYTELLDVSNLEPGLHTFTIRFQDTRSVWGSALTKFFTYYPGSTPGIHQVTDIEYWYDGNYATSVLVPLPPGVNVDLNTLLDVSSLINGLHTVSCRFKDNRGIWSSPLIRFFKVESGSELKQLVALEYWFDNDYNNKQDSVFAATTLLNLSKMLDISSLNTGFHFVNFRFQNEQGRWGPVASWYFTKKNQEDLPELHKLTALEYWFDGDYSTVQTTPVSSTAQLDFNTSLDVSSLNDGLHIISSRFRDEAGNWSSAYSRLFAKYTDENGIDLHEITELEYWFDSDYSTVQTTPVSSTAQHDFNTSLDVSSLNDGLHIISSRFRDEAGNWSPAFSRLFAKFPAKPAIDMHELTTVEYWIDNDISSSIKTQVPSGSKYIIDSQLDVSALNDGLHIITYRFQDEAGNWSPGISHLFRKFNEETFTADNKITGYRCWANNNINSAYEVTLTTPVKSLEIDQLIDISNFPGGEHVASFQFVDAQGNWSSAISQTYQKTVNPDVVISASDSTVCLGSTITFSADITDADGIEWKFGDGTTSTDFIPEHIYTDAGTFDVTVIVTHTDSAKSAYDTIVGGITVYPSQNIWLGDTDTILFSSFEDDNLNAAPSGWIQKYSGTGSENQIIVDNPVKNGVKAFQMEGASGWASEFYRRPVLMPTEVTIEAWVNCEKILSGLAGSIGLGNFDVGTWGTRTSRLQFNNGKILATYSGGPTYIIMDYTPDQWYHIKMVHDIANHLYQVYINNVLVSGINGTETTSDFPMHPTVETIDVMLAAGNSGTTKMFFDDILLGTKGDFKICETDLPYQLGSQQISTEGFYSETFTNSYGCDSVVSMNLKINPTFETELDSAVICQGDTYLLGTKTLNTTGLYKDTLQTVNGCDSVLILHLTVNPVYETQLEQTICEGNSYFFSETELTSAGTYKDTLQTVHGCDSVLVLTLTVNPAGETQVDTSICEGETYYFGGNSLTAEGIYKDTLQTSSDCDSIIILNLAVLPVSETLIDTAICKGESISFGGDLQTESGIYKDTLQSTNHCDSIIILALMVNDTFNIADTIEICESKLPLTFGNQTLTAAGNYIETFTSDLGCDSIVNLSLYVNDTLHTTVSDTICENDLPYTFGTQSLSSSGTFKETFKGKNFCDSVVTLQLTIIETNVTNQTAYIKISNLPYIFEGQALTKTGTYTRNLLNSNGCDSTIILKLYVEDDVPPEIVCNTTTIVLPENGTYTLTQDDIDNITNGTKDNLTSYRDMDITITPSIFTCEYLGETLIQATASDKNGNQAKCQVNVIVTASAMAPAVDKIADTTVYEDSQVSIPVGGIFAGTVCERKEVKITASHINLSLIDSINVKHTPMDSTAILNIQLAANESGKDTITVVVEDNEGTSTSKTFALDVAPVNDCPFIVCQLEDLNMIAHDTLCISLSTVLNAIVNDIDDSILVYNLKLANNEEKPDWFVATNTENEILIDFQPLQADTGCYNVVLEAIDPEGACATDTFELCVEKLLVGINDFYKSEPEFIMYPNPSSGKVTIEFSETLNQAVELKIMSITGAEVLRKNYLPAEQIKFDISDHISGTYLVILLTDRKRMVRTLILDKK